MNVMVLDKRGKLFSYFHQVGGHESLLRKKQYDTFFNETKANELRKWIVSERSITLHSQSALTRS